MLKTYHQFFRLLFQICDAFIVILAFAIAYWLRFNANLSWFPRASEGIATQDYYPLLLSFIFIWFLSLQVSGAYKSWRQGLIIKEFFSLFKACLLAFVTAVAGLHFLARDEFSRAFLITFGLCVFTFLILERGTLRLLLRSLRKKGWNQRHVLLVGDPKLAAEIQRRLSSRPELGLQVKQTLLIDSGVALSVQALDQLVHENGIDQVIICLKNQDAGLAGQILNALAHTNVQIRLVPDIGQFAQLGFEIEEFDGLPVISLNQSPLVGWNAVLKRLTDIVYAGVALLIFSPVMFVLAVLVKLSGRGPIFYSQERMGLDGEKFRMFKFRSMSADAEQKTGAVWAQKNDQRTTWIGALMRKTSLDELPQLWNVLIGDMSCVGPRPERPVFVEQFRHDIPGYMLRHKVKAGMTGWAQINGLRGNTSLEARIQHDLYYITNWSLTLDLRIMFLTIFRGFVSPHAY